MILDQHSDKVYSAEFAMQVAVCEACDWKFWLPVGQKPDKCPHCFSPSLVFGVDSDVDFQPEQYLPFEVTRSGVSYSIQKFASGLWFPPNDLSEKNLYERLKRIYLPVWLIDSKVCALWQAEAGYNYQVVSHQDRYDESRGGWSSQQVTETRVRWESRVGRLSRDYQNLPIPALEKHLSLMGQLGEFAFDKAQDYDPAKIFGHDPSERIFVRLPDRSQKDAWPDSLPRFQEMAAFDCQGACAAEHIRNFSWTPEFQNQHWTLLLLPVLTTFYFDDEKRPQSLLIHGQTGRIFGTRRASMKRARNTSVWIAGIAFIIFFLGVITVFGSVLFPALFLLAVVLWSLAIFLGTGAIIPIALVWWTNRQSSSNHQ